MNDIGYLSEEMCSACSEVFDTDEIVSTCPNCSAIVVACNACADDTRCWNCEYGSNWSNGKTAQDN